MNSEAKIGLLMVAFFIVVGIFTFKLGGDRMPWQADDGYRLQVYFDSTAGLQTRSRVRYAGVEVGYVESIALEDGRAKVTINLSPEVHIPGNARFVIASSGLMGDKFVAISGGTARAEALRHDDRVSGDSPVDMDQLMASINRVGIDIGEITGSLKEAIGTDRGENRLTLIMENIQTLSESLAKTTVNNDEALTETIANFHSITEDLKILIQANRENVDGTVSDIRLVASSLAETLPEITRELEKVLRSMNEIMQANRTDIDKTARYAASASENLDRSMSDFGSIMYKMDSGRGSIGKLINEDRFHENLNETLVEVTQTANEVRSFIGRVSDYRVYVGYRGEYYQNSEDWKNYISLTVQPRPDKYYLFEIVNRPRGQRIEEEFFYDFTDPPNFVSDSNKMHFTRTTWDLSNPVYSFQIAKNYHQLTLRGGLIESTGGFGLDINLLRNRLRLSFDGWDFNRSDDPHFKLTSRLNIGDTFFLTGGWDDFLRYRDDEDNLFLGAGIRFEDADLKYLLSFIPLMGN
jgi:phospholipid/cholesterol/gamma-HCH transport system substrate-binding protein